MKACHAKTRAAEQSPEVRWLSGWIRPRRDYASSEAFQQTASDRKKEYLRPAALVVPDAN